MLVLLKRQFRESFKVVYTILYCPALFAQNESNDASYAR